MIFKNRIGSPELTINCYDVEIEIVWQCLKSEELFPQELWYWLSELLDSACIANTVCMLNYCFATSSVVMLARTHVQWQRKGNLVLFFISSTRMHVLNYINTSKPEFHSSFFSYCQPDLSLRKEIKANAILLCYHFYMLLMCYHFYVA